ncbi:hypothetical protein ANCCEY_11554 [Ancylostoma ceylanicum]|uniref:Uncharacterized protein n=1 Tax=Ancylostoma ceylanicum TaxID=53326 RepID=A0A0D6LNZ3_9BILA|nr:hypothetical protein ANCCEY_11554 [Ancylostoma ceylanicum]
MSHRDVQLQIGGGGLFGGGLRGLVAAAKAAGGVNHMVTPQIDETSQLIPNHTPHANKTPAQRPYTLYTPLEDAPKSNKSSDEGGETPMRYSPPQDVYVQLVFLWLFIAQQGPITWYYHCHQIAKL